MSRRERWFTPVLCLHRNPETDLVEPGSWQQFLEQLQIIPHTRAWAMKGARAILEHMDLDAPPGRVWWATQFVELRAALAFRPHALAKNGRASIPEWYKYRRRELYRYDQWLEEWARRELRRRSKSRDPALRFRRREGLEHALKQLEAVESIPSEDLPHWRRPSAARWRRRAVKHARWLLEDAEERFRNTQWRKSHAPDKSSLEWQTSDKPAVERQSRVEFWHGECARLRAILERLS